MRSELEKELEKIQRKYKKLPSSNERILYLTQIVKHLEQQHKEDWATFRRLLDEKKLERDPVDVHNDLDEDELAISRVRLWLEAEQTGSQALDSLNNSTENDLQEKIPERSTKPSGATEDYMDIQELSEYIGMSTSTIYSWSYRHKIPCSRLGKRLVFSRKDIDAWIKKQKKR